MPYAITNQERTLFITAMNNKIQWTDNKNLAYTFPSEIKALQYEETISDFLNFDSDIFNYINDISDLIHADKKYFDVHYVPLLEAKQFSVFRGNIENTPEKLKLARELYPEPEYWIQFNYDKTNMKWVAPNYNY